MSGNYANTGYTYNQQAAIYNPYNSNTNNRNNQMNELINEKECVAIIEEYNRNNFMNIEIMEGNFVYSSYFEQTTQRKYFMGNVDAVDKDGINICKEFYGYCHRHIANGKLYYTDWHGQHSSYLECLNDAINTWIE